MGRENIIAARLGTLAINKGFLGSTMVLHAAQCYDDFSRADGPLCDGARWVDYGPSTDYTPVIEAGKVRIGIPDNLEQKIERVSYARYHRNVVTCDDGYVECRVFTRGHSVSTLEDDQRYQTVVFGRVSNDSFNDGVGIRMAASHLVITVRRDGQDYAMASFGTYAPGDIIRLRFTGNTYTVVVNGRSRGTWVDRDQIVAIDADHRSLGIRVHGAHEESGPGPRRFSPSLDYVEYGC